MDFMGTLVRMQLGPEAAEAHERLVAEMVEHCHQTFGELTAEGWTQKENLLDCERSLNQSVLNGLLDALQEMISGDEISGAGMDRLMPVLVLQATKKMAFEQFRKEVMDVTSQAN